MIDGDVGGSVAVQTVEAGGFAGRIGEPGRSFERTGEAGGMTGRTGGTGRFGC
jgi:hypothetical protein